LAENKKYELTAAKVTERATTERKRKTDDMKSYIDATIVSKPPHPPVLFNDGNHPVNKPLGAIAERKAFAASMFDELNSKIESADTKLTRGYLGDNSTAIKVVDK
jgi:hypothetical protein